MKTTLDLPDELIREVKLRAVIQGRTLRDVVADFLRQGLGMAAPQPAKPLSASSMVTVGQSGLPTIRCQPNAPAAQSSLATLLQLEQQSQTEGDLQHAGLAV